jgi:AAHS family 3-hydroxyphenylpropionic acid transporter
VAIAALAIITVMVRKAPLNLPTPEAAGHTQA